MRGKRRLAAAITLLLASACEKPSAEDASAPRVGFKASAQLPSGLIDRTTLIEYAMAARDYKPKDEFSTQEFDDAPLAEREFRVDIDMSDPKNADLQKLFSYDADKRVYNLSLWPMAIPIFLQTTALPSETRSNAFGATVEVTRKEMETIAVGPITKAYGYSDPSIKPKEIGVFKLKSEYDTTFEKTNYSFAELEKYIPMPPEKARDISRNLHLIIEGVVTKSDDGRTVECTVDGRRATIDSPFEIVTNKCTVSARFTKIQVVSPKAGILASWE